MGIAKLYNDKTDIGNIKTQSIISGLPYQTAKTTKQVRSEFLPPCIVYSVWCVRRSHTAGDWAYAMPSPDVHEKKKSKFKILIGFIKSGYKSSVGILSEGKGVLEKYVV